MTGGGPKSKLRYNSAHLRANDWQGIRRLCAIAYLTVLLIVVLIEGVPTGRASSMSLIVGGLAISCIGRGWRRLSRMLLDWLPFTLLLMVYDQSRGIAKAINLPVHVRDVASLESWLFRGRNPTVWLQDHFYDPNHVHWYDAAATVIYTSHFVVTPVLAAVLLVRNREVWIAYASRVVVLAFAAVLTYVVFPEAPPWLAAKDGVLAPVARLSARGWIWLHAGDVHELLAESQRSGANPVAAMPSLHTAFAMLVALFVASRSTNRFRNLIYVYPAVMGLVLVYTGEHYVVDVIAGVGYALAVHLAFVRAERRRVQARAGFAREAIFIH